MEFCKKLLILDYSILLVLLICLVVVSLMGKPAEGLAMVLVSWIAQIAVSSGAYFWKAKAENLVKLPIYMMDSIPDDMKDKVDPNQIISSIHHIRWRVRKQKRHDRSHAVLAKQYFTVL